MTILNSNAWWGLQLSELWNLLKNHCSFFLDFSLTVFIRRLQGFEMSFQREIQWISCLEFQRGTVVCFFSPAPAYNPISWLPLINHNIFQESRLTREQNQVVTTLWLNLDFPFPRCRILGSPVTLCCPLWALPCSALDFWEGKASNPWAPGSHLYKVQIQRPVGISAWDLHTGALILEVWAAWLLRFWLEGLWALSSVWGAWICSFLTSCLQVSWWRLLQTGEQECWN